MLHTREVAERLSNHIFLDASNVTGYTSSQGVIDIVSSRETQLLLFHIEGRRLLYDVLSLLYIAYAPLLAQL